MKRTAKEIEIHFIRTFIAFLKEQGMLIEVMLQMKDRGITFSNLVRETTKWLKENKSILRNVDFNRITQIHYARMWFLNAIYNMDIWEESEEWIYKLDQRWSMYWWHNHDKKMLKEPLPSKPERDRTEQLFINFLKRNNALIPFVVNLATGVKPQWNTPKSNRALTDLFKSNEPYSWIFDAFYWELTTEGHYYWESLNQDWRKELKRS